MELVDFESWFQSSWWTPIWVIQEAAASRCDPIMAYGAEVIRWTAVEDFVYNHRGLEIYRSELIKVGVDLDLVFSSLRWSVQKIFGVINRIPLDHRHQMPQSLEELDINTRN